MLMYMLVYVAESSSTGFNFEQVSHQITTNRRYLETKHTSKHTKVVNGVHLVVLLHDSGFSVHAGLKTISLYSRKSKMKQCLVTNS